MRYQTYDYFAKASEAFHHGFTAMHELTAHQYNPFRKTLPGKVFNASLETALRMTKRYEKLEFDIESIEVDGKHVAVREETVLEKPFCNLVHFRLRGSRENCSKVLLVAPLSGHHATLLKPTVEGLLAKHEVYITDWHDCRDVPLSEGEFTFDRYVNYLIDFMEFLEEDFHVIAICQPTVQALIATAVMAQENNPATPKSLTLMAGPIDPSVNPTRVNEYAHEHSMDWFRGFAIMTVPSGYPGAGRKVYPGFLQLGGFLSMNLDTHINKSMMFFQNLIAGEEEDADRYRAFYDEYMAVLDIPADFYLETIEKVFKDNEVATGSITYKGKPVDFNAIKKTALLTVEGANDDICGMGQTEAAHDVCSKIPKKMRKHLLQEGVGHYGVFSGSRFRKFIRPTITEFIESYD
ncbi:MAG: polyhydroxyalkanoate depolymerase [Cellvibrionaceae bacterium]